MRVTAASGGDPVKYRLSTLPSLVVALALATALHAQSYPSKPIRIVVPFPPGDSLDIMSRLITPKLLERLGQNIVVDNRQGSSDSRSSRMPHRTDTRLAEGRAGTSPCSPTRTRNCLTTRSRISYP
jgi:hypothetical protein